MALIVIGAIVLVWVAFFLLIKYLEISEPERVYRVMDRMKLSINVFYINWDTSSLNVLFYKAWGKNLLRLWFFVGVISGFICMLASIVLLVGNICYVTYMSLWYSEDKTSNGVLTPVIPGVNVPSSHLGYYVFALLVAGVLHEFGHGFAAASEKCKVKSFGLRLVVALYPAAYVDLCDQQLKKLTPLSQLRVYCAGAWHNAVITAACFLLLYALPYLVSPLYAYSSGTYIIGINPDSGFDARLSVGDVIVGIGGYTTKTAKDFDHSILLLDQSLANNSFGYCLTDAYLTDNAKNTMDCFDEKYEGALQSFVSNLDGKQYCLVASDVMKNPECRSEGIMSGCQCLLPHLPPGVALLQLHVVPKDKLSSLDVQHITFVGKPLDLWDTFKVRDYMFRFESLSFFDIDFPFMITKTLKYLASISAALALLNMAPVYFLDGEWCLKPFLQIFETIFGITLLTHRATPPCSHAPQTSSYSQSPLPSTHRNPSNTPFHFVGNKDTLKPPNFMTQHVEQNEKEDTKHEDEPLVRNILRVMSVLFVINIGLSFFNLSTK